MPAPHAAPPRHWPVLLLHRSPTPDVDPKQLFFFTILKSKGNLLYLLAQQIREGSAPQGAEAEVRKLIGELKHPSG